MINEEISKEIRDEFAKIERNAGPAGWPEMRDWLRYNAQQPYMPALLRVLAQYDIEMQAFPEPNIVFNLDASEVCKLEYQLGKEYSFFIREASKRFSSWQKKQDSDSWAKYTLFDAMAQFVDAVACLIQGNNPRGVEEALKATFTSSKY